MGIHYTHVSLLLCKLHWPLAGLWVQFKVLDVICKALHGIGQGYLRNHLSPVVFAYLVHLGRMDPLQVHSIKCHLVTDKSMPFVTDLSSKTASFRDRYGTHSLGFQKAFKTWWLCCTMFVGPLSCLFV